LPLRGSPPWWPMGWLRRWRIAVLLYDARGRVCGLHARAVGDEHEPKCRSPFADGAFDCGGLFFANGRGRLVLKGIPLLDTAAIQITEGLTDTLTASARSGNLPA
jgi:hypothetical protein